MAQAPSKEEFANISNLEEKDHCCTYDEDNRSIASLWRSLLTASIHEIERLDDSPHQGTMPHYTLGTPRFTCLTPLPCLSPTESMAVP